MQTPHSVASDLGQTPHSVVSDLGLHCLPMSFLKDARHKWVNEFFASHVGLYLSEV